VSFSTVYIDESGTHEGSKVVCVAGFLYEGGHASLLEAEWKAVLERERMPYFRMSLFKDGRPPFDHMSRDLRISVEKELISIINKYRRFVFSSAVNEHLLLQVAKQEGDPGWMTAYTHGLMDCLSMIRYWADANDFHQKIAYFFEAGHRDQSRANRIMNAAFLKRTFGQEPALNLRYGSHTFIDKNDAVPLQTSDLLAWLSANAYTKLIAGKQPAARKDLAALLYCYESRHRGSVHLWDEARLRLRFKGKPIPQSPDDVAAFLGPLF
jgi:hypothetical protein